MLECSVLFLKIHVAHMRTQIPSWNWKNKQGNKEHCWQEGLLLS